MLKKALVIAAAAGLTLTGAATAQAATQAAWPPPNTNGTYDVKYGGGAASSGTWRHWYELLFDADHVEVKGKLTVTDNQCYYLMANKATSRVLCDPGTVDVKISLTAPFVHTVVGPVDVKVCRTPNTGTPDGADCGSAQRVNG
ncbi:hypothetical protein GCM10029964_124740 [Kibdelosporangium lantanae]